MVLPVYTFDPKYATDTDGFTFDLTAWLGDDDSISGTPTATVTPTGTTVQAVVAEGGLVTVWIAGGTAGQKYIVEVHVLTTGAAQSQVGRDCRVRGSFMVEA